MRSFLNITKALADETRLRILMALGRGELCVCQLVALLELAPSTVSRHVYLLTQAGLIDKRKSGKWVFYQLAGSAAPVVVRKSLALTALSLGKNRSILRDAARLADLKTLPLEEICQPLNQKRRGKANR